MYVLRCWCNHSGNSRLHHCWHSYSPPASAHTLGACIMLCQHTLPASTTPVCIHPQMEQRHEQDIQGMWASWGGHCTLNCLLIMDMPQKLAKRYAHVRASITVVPLLQNCGEKGNTKKISLPSTLPTCLWPSMEYGLHTAAHHSTQTSVHKALPGSPNLQEQGTWNRLCYKAILYRL